MTKINFLHILNWGPSYSCIQSSQNPVISDSSILLKLCIPLLPVANALAEALMVPHLNLDHRFPTYLCSCFDNSKHSVYIAPFRTQYLCNFFVYQLSLMSPCVNLVSVSPSHMYLNLWPPNYLSFRKGHYFRHFWLCILLFLLLRMFHPPYQSIQIPDIPEDSTESPPPLQTFPNT